jgi:hypothetical protein
MASAPLTPASSPLCGARESGGAVGLPLPACGERAGVRGRGQPHLADGGAKPGRERYPMRVPGSGGPFNSTVLPSGSVM